MCRRAPLLRAVLLARDALFPCIQEQRREEQRRRQESLEEAEEETPMEELVA